MRPVAPRMVADLMMTVGFPSEIGLEVEARYWSEIGVALPTSVREVKDQVDEK
jgi:hypothetical protein